MKRVFILLLFVIAAFAITAQNNQINLRFVGTKLDGSYCRLSKVNVENLSRGWTETLVYPDTLLQLTATVGIATADEGSLQLEGYPNPFNGETNLRMSIAEGGNITLSVYDLSGRRVAEHSQQVQSGNHLFKISLQRPQVYMLVATTPQGSAVLKLINRTEGSPNAITDFGAAPSNNEKLVSSQRFQIGDLMRYTGYIINGTDTLGSNQKTQAQTSSEIILLSFASRPTVTTASVTNILDTVAECGGNVTADGGAAVFSRGVCWSTSPNPTIYNNRTSDGNSTGAFNSTMTGLVAGTTYYVRAYATNSAGTSYGNQQTFVTLELPTVTTSSISSITASSAVSGGIVTNDGGSAVTARGVCWSTSPAPTIMNSITIDSNGAGAYVSNIAGLVSGTTYYVRAYATNIVGTAYGTERTFTTQQVPVLTTDTVVAIIDTAATFKGTVAANGDSQVLERGFCWSTSPSPTVADDTVRAGSGLGAYQKSVNTLASGTTYYLRAYATSAIGTGYGREIVFHTNGAPTVVTDSMGIVTTTSAVFNGRVTYNGGDSVLARGFCWSTFPNPTLSDNTISRGSGMGSFTSTVSQLSPGTVYYLRAYATNSYGTGYGNQIAFSTVNPAFSVSEVRTIGFSTGNLQYTTTGTHVTSDTILDGTWRFALHQYDTVGTANALISSSYNGWIDLFGWGTSGYNNRYPYLSTDSMTAYDNGHQNLSGTKYDWGTYNAVQNGGNQPNTWFVLTKEEWMYLLYTRDGAANKFGHANVAGINGMVLLPDSWSSPIGTYFAPGFANGFATNTYTAAQWDVMESYGAIFLPATGYRYDSTRIAGLGSYGHYWTASADSNSSTHYLSFAFDRASIESYRNSQGKSVRLVRILSEKPTLTTDSIKLITNESAEFVGTVVDTGRSAILSCGFCWSTMPMPTLADNVVYSSNSQMGRYRSQVVNLASGTKYYVRSFASDGDGVMYGNQQIFTTLGKTISGRFSVSQNRTVRIAHGNLQYTNMGSHIVANNDTASGIWSFAADQYECLGIANNDISDTNMGLIDLFGWRSSGYVTKPYQSSAIDSLYGSDSLNIDNMRHDWGVNNQIYCPVLDLYYDPGTWRTLSQSEWAYIINVRPNAAYKVGPAMVDGKGGIVLLPDEWIQPAGIYFNPSFGYGFSYNTYTPVQWSEMEDHGAVFLPAAGARDTVSISNFLDNGCYWTTTAHGQSQASFLIFNGLQVNYTSALNRHWGLSVRLAKDETDW